ARHFRCAKPPCAVVRFAAMTSSPRTNILAYPAFAPLKRGPSANNPALVAIRLHFAARNRACGYRPHLLGLPRKIRRGISLRETTLCGCPLRGHDFVTPHQYFAVPVTAAPRRVPNGKNPALAPVRSHFACGETGPAGRCPRWGQRARYPIFALLKCGPALAPRRSSAYASVSPAAKPRVRSSAPPFGFAAQNQARHFAARNHPVRLSASRP
ncbi:hypothetical protein HMPREF1032_03875, partial [Subdoligranulum sp. 4_3_54A2FAA]